MKISRIISLIGLALLLLGRPAVGFAQERNSPESEMTEIKITISGSNARVVNAMQSTLEIYNITGVKIASYKIDSSDKTISLGLGKGCYILKVDRVVRKISLR